MDGFDMFPDLEISQLTSSLPEEPLDSVAPQVMARIELTPTATRREDELQSYVELRRDYSDEQIVLCLEHIGNRFHYPISSLRVWIDGVISRTPRLTGSAQSVPMSPSSQEIVERAERLYSAARNRFENMILGQPAQDAVLKTFAPTFPLPQFWLDRLAIISWDEDALSSQSGELGEWLWTQPSAMPDLLDK